MAEDDLWRQLIAGLRAGDARAEHEFWGQYGSALQRLAERRLSPKLMARVGPDDVAQSACRTFLRRARGGEFHLADSNALWQILCVLTLTKVREQARFHRRKKRSIDQEHPLARAADDSVGGEPDPADPGDGPAEALAIAEEMERVLGSLDQDERQIVDLKLQDLTNDEVARQLNLSERTVRRMLKAVRNRLERTAAGDER